MMMDYFTYQKLVKNFKLAAAQYKYLKTDTTENSYVNNDVLQAITIYNDILDSQNYNHCIHLR